jgi:hypothetical protein
VACSHLVFVGAGVKVVAVDKLHAQFAAEGSADCRFAGSGNTHHNEGWKL